MRFPVLCALLTVSLSAADIAGRWRGTITTEMARETTGGSIPAYMVLEQSNHKVTGTAGPDEKMQVKIRTAVLEGDRLTVEASPREGAVLRFVLTVKGDTIEGDVAENGTVIGTAKLTRLHN
jgi:hypothetical protein